MADSEPFSDDISALWGDTDQDVLEPPRPNGFLTSGHEPDPAPTNGSQVELTVAEPRDPVAPLAHALAGHPAEVVRRPELGAMRTEMEDAFTQKLAVAIYELLSASNERFSSVEDHMDRRLEDVVGELNQCIRSQSDRLAAAIENQQRMTTDIALQTRDELLQMGEGITGPVDTLAAVAWEVVDEVGRVGDLVAAQNAETVRRSEDAAQAGAALSERLASSGIQDAAAKGSLEAITERISSVQSDLKNMHEAIRALQEEVSKLSQRPGAWRRWGRSG